MSNGGVFAKTYRVLSLIFMPAFEVNVAATFSLIVVTIR